jgi:hypothetical protein
VRDLLNIKLFLPKKKRRRWAEIHFWSLYLGGVSIWSQCFNFIQLDPCVFKPFSILPLESTPYVVDGKLSWPTQLPSNCVPPFIRMCLLCGCVNQQNTKPTHESFKSGERATVILKKEISKSEIPKSPKFHSSQV